MAGSSDCESRGCFPPIGSLLTGRSSRLTATSQNNDHPVSNLITPLGDKYYESEENREAVSITLDLEAEMKLSSVSIHFPTPEDKPDGIIFSRSVDFGQRFRTYHYAARDCEDVFSIASENRVSAQGIVCETMNGSSTEVRFQVIPECDNCHLVQWYISRITNLRINLTDFGKRSNRTSYRISKLNVLGSCFCYGHASECEIGTDGMILPACKCQHNTNGTNCELCQELYNDRQWSIGIESAANECVKCNCNDRADSCFFDEQAFQSSGNKSGGVCLGCKNSTGPECRSCRSFYYNDGTACRPCGCNDTGTLSNLCDGTTGQCDCLSGFIGRDCATRKP